MSRATTSPSINRVSLSSRITRIFVAGLLAIFPVVATVLLLVFVARVAINWLGPNSWFGQVLVRMGLGVTGSEWIGYLIGLLLVAAIIFALGLFVEKGLQRWFHSVIDGLIGRIPIVRTVYETLRQFVSLVSRRGESQLNSMQPVWCEFGGQGGVKVLALLSASEPVLVNGELCYAVIVPTAPVPIGGGLLFVPMEWITNAEIGMEALSSIYVSMGVTAPQFLRPR